MALFGVQKSDFKVLKPRPNYEFVVKSIEEVPNDRGQFKYDPEKDEPKMATKLEWTFIGRPGTEAEGVKVSKRVPSYLTSDTRNGWLQFSSAADPEFDIAVGYKDMDDLVKRCVGRPVMLAISNTEKTKNGEKIVYNNIDKAYPSDKGELSEDENLKMFVGAGGSVDGEEIPF